jgi:ribosomal protein L11 methyltransferase
MMIRRISMNWIEVSIETTSQAVDAVCAKLISIGIEGMRIEDSLDFQEFIEDKKATWDYVDESLIEQKKAPTAVIVYLSDTPEGRDTLSTLRTEVALLPSQLEDINFGTLKISLNTVRESDWEESWKQYYKITPIGEKLLIVPEWEPVPETNRSVFINDPGLAFGTGTHASTRLSLELLEKHIRQGDNLLDLGCGSGILSICGLLMGADRATAVDIDPNAVPIAMKNAERNSISPERFTTYVGDVLTDKQLIDRILQSNSGALEYRIVLANIVADVIMRLPPLVKAAISKEDGVFIASGIIEPRLHEVENALVDAGMNIVETITSEGWSAIVAQTS